MTSTTAYASLPWYDLEETRAFTDELWARLRERLVAHGVADAPLALDRAVPHGVDPGGRCLFTQTCGLPIFTTAREHFAVLGAPCYDAPGCDGPLHRSFVVVRDDATARALEDLRGGRFAINELDSNSGMNLPRRLVAPLARGGRFFGGTVVSGGHVASAALVSSGAADAAAIDCVTYALLRRYRPQAVARLRVVAETAATPAPPLVTSASTPAATVAALRRALAEVVAAQRGGPLFAALGIASVEPCGEAAYDVVMRYEREAAALGYPVLA